MELKLIDRVVRKRGAHGGCYWGSDRWVLARIGDKELWWWKGCFAQRYDYIQAQLMLVPEAEKNNRGEAHSSKDVFEGGRLSKARLAEHAKRIDAFFGVPGLTKMLDPRKTLVPADEPDHIKQGKGA